MQLGEGFVGDGADAAHVNTVLGRRDGPVGTAWATALATPSAGHAPFVVVVRPGLPVQPFTLFVNKAAIASDRHAELTWGAAQAGVAGGVADAAIADPDGLVLIAAVWVNPDASDADAVYRNNREATRVALTSPAPGADQVRAEAATPWNPFFPR
jgi:5,6,7,8-tetrahydromethanopterin hydro-lyase